MILIIIVYVCAYLLVCAGALVCDQVCVHVLRSVEGQPWILFISLCPCFLF